MPEERQNYVQNLRSALAHADEARQTQQAAMQAASRPQAKAVPAEDLTPLAEADRAIYLKIDEQRQAGQHNEAFHAATALADGYPDFLPAQQKACELGMQFGVGPRRIQVYCDRMSKLFAQPR